MTKEVKNEFFRSLLEAVWGVSQRCSVIAQFPWSPQFGNASIVDFPPIPSEGARVFITLT